MINLGGVIEWKLKKLDKWKDQVSIRTINNILTEWNVAGMNQPDEATLQSWCDEYDATGIYEQSFNVDSFLIELEEALGESASDDLASHVRRFERYASRKDFGKIKRLGQRLVQKGEMTQQQFNGMKALFLSKGINLDNY